MRPGVLELGLLEIIADLDFEILRVGVGFHFFLLTIDDWKGV
jgi:hypothetical protein